MHFITNLFFILILITLNMSCSLKKQTTIRVGINAWPGYEFLYLAKELKFFEKRNVDVKVVEFNSLADARRAFENGDIDVLGTTVSELVLSRNNSKLPTTLFYVVDYSDGADVIIGQPEINEVKNLKSKKIGVEVGSISLYVLLRALEKYSLSLSDVEIVSLDQGQILEKMANKKIDAAVTYPPFSIKLSENKKFKTIFSTKELPNEVIDILAGRKDLIEKDRETYIKIIDAFEEAKKIGSIQNSKEMKMMADREKITTEDFYLSLTDGLKLVEREGQRKVFLESGLIDSIINKNLEMFKKVGLVNNSLKLDNMVTLIDEK